MRLSNAAAPDDQVFVVLRRQRGGVFEVLFGAEDAIISDELDHASIIDGVRLCKAARYRYRNADMADLRMQLEAAADAGGYVAAHQAIMDLLRQRSRPYLFSNSVAPGVVASSLKALELVDSSSEARETWSRTRRCSLL